MKVLERDSVIYSLDKRHEPKLTVKSGESFSVETEDCYSHQITAEMEKPRQSIDRSFMNPATGPIFVDDARPGDALKIHIDEIHLHDRGVITTGSGVGALGDLVDQGTARVAIIVDDEVKLFGYSLELRPMVGVIGVAPDGEGVKCDTPGPHGGNIDTLNVTEGAIVYLPVQVEGAKLALGDVHATMGDGEVCGTGVETRARVDIRAEVVKEESLSLPIIEHGDCYYVLGSGKNLDKAVKAAVKGAVEFIEENSSLSWQEAYMLASVSTHLKVSQVVNPLETARVEIPGRFIQRG